MGGNHTVSPSLSLRILLVPLGFSFDDMRLPSACPREERGRIVPFICLVLHRRLGDRIFARGKDRRSEEDDWFFLTSRFPNPCQKAGHGSAAELDLQPFALSTSLDFPEPLIWSQTPELIRLMP
jgi:hypothetical protein